MESAKQLEQVVPIGMRVLVRKDEDRSTSKGGIILPDTMEIPVLTGRIVAISDKIDSDPDYPLSVYDKVLVNPSNIVPVDLEPDNRLFILHVDNVVAVIHRE